MRNLCIEINDNHYQKDFSVKEDTNFIFLIQKNIDTKIRFDVYKNVNIKVKVLSTSDNDSELEIEARLHENNINYDLRSLALIDNHSRKSNLIITIPRGATGCVASEKEEAFLLDNIAKNDATVAVFSNEKDSAISHSYVCNKIAKRELLLLASRGINKQQAQKLLLDTKMKNFIVNDF